MRIRTRRIFLVAGLLAGFIFGLPVRADFHVTLECSADVYALADSVRFTWRNDTDSTVVATYHPPYVILNELGRIIYWGILPWEYSLGPHSSVDLTWDQIDGWGVPVPVGLYTVSIWYVFNDTPPGYEVSDEFMIQAPATVPEDDLPPEAGSWGELKSAYR